MYLLLQYGGAKSAAGTDAGSAGDSGGGPGSPRGSSQTGSAACWGQGAGTTGSGVTCHGTGGPGVGLARTGNPWKKLLTTISTALEFFENSLYFDFVIY